MDDPVTDDETGETTFFANSKNPKHPVPKSLVAHQVNYLISRGANPQHRAYWVQHMNHDETFLPEIVKTLTQESRDIVFEAAFVRGHLMDVDIVLRVGLGISELNWENGCSFALEKNKPKLMEIMTIWMGSGWVDFLARFLQVCVPFKWKCSVKCS